jgi:aspartyl-tRNA(Asn)/glutamyl-tRNA(Gln) amidotransferase subunit B
VETWSLPPGYEAVIGLEIHLQLRTRSKMFCGCQVEFGAPPNTLVCPVCLGLPGALPVPNRQALTLALRAALALGCEIHPHSVFARKHYFYPDLPKGYQITQYDRPLASGGSLALPVGPAGAPDRVRLRRLHLEEDAGKSLHDRFPGESAIDLNRAGVPLLEIVTEPDLRRPAQARAFLGRMKQTLEYLEVSDCNMEEGSLRVDANVSVRKHGSAGAAIKTEVKNMNSFSQLERALEFEAKRHVAILEGGGAVEHETMLWDAARGEARPMRGKEEVHDYRYFPEPDLPPLVVPASLVASLAAELPELPWQRIARFRSDYALAAADAEVLCATRALADYFEAVARASARPKVAAHWVTREILALLNERGLALAELQVAPAELAELIEIVESGRLSRGLGMEVLRRMAESGQGAGEVMEAADLRTVFDSGRIEAWVAAALAEHPGEVERYRKGESQLLAFFMGQVMRKSQGKADPEQVRLALQRALEL